ncbi:MAG: tetratricopeptide repeat protein [Chloroflexi bacterium]|nr:tetratricopeptide repeat protein [Chloroflexota bacterium]
MAEIALRTYNQEVQDLIDHGRLDEAIAHGQHILARYPKHVETYRLLGKAYLEQSRHADAADIFQRVLSAIPDDFLSHVAMAIMREDSGNLDAAIWHMERAHEVNPSNPTVQQEVRRLRGRRDGVEPARLRLTRAALARMYIKGGFFAQAVAEIRAALEEDADRPDLQVMLASALAQSGQAAEAGEICNAVLGKLPYCVEANQIQAQILWRVGRKAEAQEVFRRLSLLDPYRGVRPPTDDGRMPEVPAGAVTLARLTWEPGMSSASQPPPGWKEGLGLGAEEGSGEETKIPDWLESAAPGAHQAPFVQDAEAGLVPAPDWLSEGGPGLAVSADGAEALLGPDEPETSLAAAAEDLPDWLRQVPAETKSETAPGSFPDWLKPEGMAGAEAKDVGDAPDWLKAAEQDAGLSVPGEGLPDWVGHDAPEAEPLPPAHPAERLPGWLQAEAPEPSGSSPTQEFPELSAIPGAAPKPGDSGSHDLDWLRSEAQKAPGSPPFEEGGAVVDDGSAAGEVTLPDWLKPVGAADRDEDRGSVPIVPFTDGEKGPESEAQPETPSPERPTWLASDEVPVLWRDVKAEPAATEKDDADKAAGTAPLAARTPGWPALPEEGISQEAEPAETPQGDGSEWLKRLPTEPSSPADMEAPAWLKSEAFESTRPDETEKPEWLRPATEETPAEIGEIPDWLKAAGRVIPTPAPEPGAQDQSAAEAPARSDMPDWLKPVGAEDQPPLSIPKIVAAPPAEAEKPHGGEAPGWLLELASQTTAEPIPEPEPASELPAWLDERQPGASDTISRWLGRNTPGGAGEEYPSPEPAEGEVPSWMRAMAGESGLPGRPTDEASDEARRAEGAATPAPMGEPATGDMPTPDWIKAAMGEVESEVSSAFPVTGEAPSREAEAPSAARPPQAVAPAPPAQPARAMPEPRPIEKAPTGIEPDVPQRPATPVKPPAPAAPSPAKPPRVVPLPPPEMGEEPLPAAAPEPGTWVPLEPTAAKRPTPEPKPEPVPAPPAPTLAVLPSAAPEPKAKPRRAPRRKPSRLTHAECEALLAEARAQMNTGRVEDAVRSYQRVLEGGGDAAQIAADLERAVENKPLVAELWQTLGDAWQRAGKLDRAYQAYEKALHLL